MTFVACIATVLPKWSKCWTWTCSIHNQLTRKLLTTACLTTSINALFRMISCIVLPVRFCAAYSGHTTDTSCNVAAENCRGKYRQRPKRFLRTSGKISVDSRESLWELEGSGQRTLRKSLKNLKEMLWRLQGNVPRSSKRNSKNLKKDFQELWRRTHRATRNFRDLQCTV